MFTCKLIEKKHSCRFLDLKLLAVTLLDVRNAYASERDNTEWSSQNKIGREGGFLLVAEAVTQNPVNNNSISLLLPPYGSQQPQTSAKPLFPIEGWECHVGFEIVSFGLGWLNRGNGWDGSLRKWNSGPGGGYNGIYPRSFLGNDLKQFHWGSTKGPHPRLLVATHLNGTRWCR